MTGPRPGEARARGRDGRPVPTSKLEAVTRHYWSAARAIDGWADAPVTELTALTALGSLAARGPTATLRAAAARHLARRDLDAAADILIARLESLAPPAGPTADPPCDSA